MEKEDLDALSSAQLGLLTRRQAVTLLGRRGVAKAVSDRSLVPTRRGVVRCAGTPPTYRQRALAACLACGDPVAVSHTSAAALWAFEAVAPADQIEVIVPPGRSGRQPDLRVHRCRLAESEVTQRFGIPVTSLARTLLDLAAVVAEPVLARCVDDALRRGTSPEVLERRLLESGWGRRPGSATLRRLIAARVGHHVGDSPGVDRMLEWISRAGLPRPVCDHPVEAAGRRRFIDAAYPELQVAMEFNGWDFHKMRSRVDDDHARTNELELLGWVVLVVTAAHGEAETIDRIRRALALQSARLGRA